jgi:BirA family biotin operon repressor/biotin-[acetyl-CoA-carboxylase] ligase
MLADESAREGDWLVALQQDQGRGRQGRDWQSLEGNFAGSTLVIVRDDDPLPQTLSLAAGLALIDAVDLAAPGRGTRLKWPNDLMLDGGKLAGILLERSGDRIAVGFGVNLASAPAIAGRQVAALDGVISAPAFAPLLAGSFERVIAAWRTSEPAMFAAAWLERAHPIGAPLKVHSEGGRVVTGKFDGIEGDGALRLRADDGAVEIVRAGDVEIG